MQIMDENLFIHSKVCILIQKRMIPFKDFMAILLIPSIEKRGIDH